VSDHWDVVGELRREGHRLTPQRLLVLEIMEASQGHLTADQVLDRLKESYPSINLATVYRSLQWLKEAGRLVETDLGEGRRVFSYLSTHRHHHLICLNCGAIREIPDNILDPVREQIRASYGFEPRMDHFALYGVCSECQAKQSSH
jgi:Fur family transcriptional regulator, ferric uptake regulator